MVLIDDGDKVRDCVEGLFPLALGLLDCLFNTFAFVDFTMQAFVSHNQLFRPFGNLVFEHALKISLHDGISVREGQRKKHPLEQVRDLQRLGQHKAEWDNTRQHTDIHHSENRQQDVSEK